MHGAQRSSCLLATRGRRTPLLIGIVARLNDAARIIIFAFVITKTRVSVVDRAANGFVAVFVARHDRLGVAFVDAGLHVGDAARGFGLVVLEPSFAHAFVQAGTVRFTDLRVAVDAFAFG
jgi:hypothetical protein